MRLDNLDRADEMNLSLCHGETCRVYGVVPEALTKSYPVSLVHR